MHILIFAGGAGTRLWPISRSASPKQFEKLKDNTSTLQMAVARVEDFGMEQIYISTNAQYRDIVQTQVPQILPSHIMSEPARRDLAAAVLLSLVRLKKNGVSGTIALLWADHFMHHPHNFREALTRASALIDENPHRFVFLAEQPRFANHNLGWIKMGGVITPGVHSFEGWKYRPELSMCRDMFASGEWYWNPGYFVVNSDFLLELYREHQRELYDRVTTMVAEDAVDTEYAQLPALSFDTAIIEKLPMSQAVVLPVNLGWSDPGTLYALKEALHTAPEHNVSIGNTHQLHTSDSFIFNDEPKKLVSVIGLEGMIVVNTKDALLVCHKDNVPEIKQLLAELEAQGNEHYL